MCDFSGSRRPVAQRASSSTFFANHVQPHSASCNGAKPVWVQKQPAADAAATRLSFYSERASAGGWLAHVQRVYNWLNQEFTKKPGSARLSA